MSLACVEFARTERFRAVAREVGKAVVESFVGLRELRILDMHAERVFSFLWDGLLA
jgi:hypothetical protein